MPDWAFHYSGYLVAAIACVLLLLALFKDRARGRSRCRKCWYDLKELGDLPVTCPECGKEHTKPKHLTRTRRHKRLAAVWLLVMVVGGYGLWTTPRVMARGWVGAVPTTAMVAAAPWVNDDWCRSSKTGQELYDELKDRLYAGQHPALLWSSGHYWSLAGVQNVWPMSRAGPSAEARKTICVADYLFVPFLKNGYGSREDQVEYVVRSMFRGRGLSIDGFAIYGANRKVVGISVDIVSKAPGDRPFVVFLEPVGDSGARGVKPDQPYTQNFPGEGFRSSWVKSPEVTLWLNSAGIGSALIWIESARGVGLGCYRVEWSLDSRFLEEGESYVFLDIERWGVLSD